VLRPGATGHHGECRRDYIHEHGAGGRKPSPDSPLSGAASRQSCRHDLEPERMNTKSVTNADGTTSLLTIHVSGSSPVWSITHGPAAQSGRSGMFRRTLVVTVFEFTRRMPAGLHGSAPAFGRRSMVQIHPRFARSGVAQDKVSQILVAAPFPCRREGVANAGGTTLVRPQGSRFDSSRKRVIPLARQLSPSLVATTCTAPNSGFLPEMAGVYGRNGPWNGHSSF
jgi:hypothetical protein